MLMILIIEKHSNYNYEIYKGINILKVILKLCLNSVSFGDFICDLILANIIHLLNISTLLSQHLITYS